MCVEVCVRHSWPLVIFTCEPTHLIDALLFKMYSFFELLGLVFLLHSNGVDVRARDRACLLV